MIKKDLHDQKWEDRKTKIIGRKIIKHEFWPQQEKNIYVLIYLYKKTLSKQCKKLKCGQSVYNKAMLSKF